jgi:putative ABC transport system permease protein
MTLTRLLRRSLAFHRRANLALLLGVAVGTAVLTGALLVGDSLRGSLRDRALRRLNILDQDGWVEEAMVSGRLIRQQVAQKVNDLFVERGVTLRGTAGLAGQDDGGRLVGGVTVWATRIDLCSRSLDPQPKYDPGWRVWQYLPAFRPTFSRQEVAPYDIAPGKAWLAPAVAEALGVKTGDAVTLRVTKPSAIPNESLLGRRGLDDTGQTVTATVDGIVSDEDPAADFSLAPAVRPPLNVFVNLRWLQNQIGEPGRVNVLMTAGRPLTELQEQLRQLLTLDDWGVVIHTPESRADDLIRRYDQNKNRKLEPREWQRRIPEVIAKAADTDSNGTLTRDELFDYYRRRGIVTLESRQLVIEPAVERAALEVAKEMGLKAMPTLVYLANSISDGKESIPYSVVGAVDPHDPPVADVPGSPLNDDEILLVQWPESPLTAKPGDTITLTYFDPNQEGQLKERTATFRLKGYIPLEGAAADPDLTPEFPGITDKLGLRDWDPPFPYDNSKIGKRDEDYWAKYRTTPKAYVTLAAGRKLFGTRFGDLTSIRLASPERPEELAKEFSQRLLKTLRPEQGGFVFEDVRERALRASGGGMDFGLLFLGFSLFLIAAALVLVGLLVRLGLDRRATEIGLLLATGYRTRTVRRLLLAEEMIMAALGGLLGLAGAIGYAASMLRLLSALWPAGSVGSFLTLHVNGTSLAIGYLAALVVCGFTIWWAVRALNRIAPSALLAGVTQTENSDTRHETRDTRKSRFSLVSRVSCLVSGLGLIVGGLFVHDAEARAGTFFSGGMLLLIAALAAVRGWLRRPIHGHVHPGDMAAIAKLGIRNAARNPTRSLLTAALIASAAFLLVAVESFRRSPEADFSDKRGGSGGFALIAETDLPLYRDPASPEGRQDMLDALEKVYQRDPATKPKKLMDAQNLLDPKITPIIPLRLKAGDDASCLNLYQPGRPRVLGVPKSLIERGGFRFAGTETKTPEERANPWLLLNQPSEDGTIPVFGEQHSVQWMLKSDLGGTIEIPDEQGLPRKLRFVGLLQDSAFQSEILMSDLNFLKLFPRHEGFSVFLLDPPAGNQQDVTSLFQTALDSRGVTITPARERLANYLAVENTYLSTFQVLGGFGLLLGALGLAVVLLRNVWERRGELALLRALGYRHRALGWLVFAENAALLLLGLGAGVGSAAAAVAPHVLTGEGAVPWVRLGGLLGLVLAVGFAAGGMAVRSTVRAPLVPALRKE